MPLNDVRLVKNQTM